MDNMSDPAKLGQYEDDEPVRSGAGYLHGGKWVEYGSDEDVEIQMAEAPANSAKEAPALSKPAPISMPAKSLRAGLIDVYKGQDYELDINELDKFSGEDVLKRHVKKIVPLNERMDLRLPTVISGQMTTNVHTEFEDQNPVVIGTTPGLPLGGHEAIKSQDGIAIDESDERIVIVMAQGNSASTNHTIKKKQNTELSAASSAAVVDAATRLDAKKPTDLEGVLGEMNRMVHRTKGLQGLSMKNANASVFAAELDIKNNVLKVASAGDVRCIIFDPNDGSFVATPLQTFEASVNTNQQAVTEFRDDLNRRIGMAKMLDDEKLVASFINRHVAYEFSLSKENAQALFDRPGISVKEARELMIRKAAREQKIPAATAGKKLMQAAGMPNFRPHTMEIPVQPGYEVLIVSNETAEVFGEDIDSQNKALVSNAIEAQRNVGKNSIDNVVAQHILRSAIKAQQDKKVAEGTSFSVVGFNVPSGKKTSITSKPSEQPEHDKSAPTLPKIDEAEIASMFQNITSSNDKVVPEANIPVAPKVEAPVSQPTPMSQPGLSRRKGPVAPPEKIDIPDDDFDNLGPEK